MKKPEINEDPHRRVFVQHLLRNLFVGITLILISLSIGMAGYRHYEKMSWIDAYLNSSMILAGMGPAAELKTDSGKLFAGTYALFCGIFFLIIIAVIIAPIVHRFFKKYHIEESQTK